MYEVEFLESGKTAECQWLADVVRLVREQYPNAVGRKCPDGGYMFWRDQLEQLVFDAREDHDGADGMAIAECTAKRPEATVRSN